MVRALPARGGRYRAEPSARPSLSASGGSALGRCSWGVTGVEGPDLQASHGERQARPLPGQRTRLRSRQASTVAGPDRMSRPSRQSRTYEAWSHRTRPPSERQRGSSHPWCSARKISAVRRFSGAPGGMISRCIPVWGAPSGGMQCREGPRGRRAIGRAGLEPRPPESASGVWSG